MIRHLTLIPAALIAGPALAHEGAGVFHLHPHGGEALLVGLALVVAVGAWALARRR